MNPKNDRLIGGTKCVFRWDDESAAGHRRQLGQAGFVGVVNEVFFRIGNHSAGYLRMHDLAAPLLHDVDEIRSDIIRREIKFIPPRSSLRHPKLLLLQVRRDKGDVALQLVQEISGLTKGVNRKVCVSFLLLDFRLKLLSVVLRIVSRANCAQNLP